jgi:hypothetical protein
VSAPVDDDCQRERVSRRIAEHELRRDATLAEIDADTIARSD